MRIPFVCQVFLYFGVFLFVYRHAFYHFWPVAQDPSATDNIRFHDFTDSSKLEGVTELPVKVVDDVNKQLRRNPNRCKLLTARIV